MKISTKGEYGLRAMLYLAMHEGDRPVTSSEIAKHQGIPEPYLRQILALLSRDRLVISNRGPQGGHSLGRPAAEISVREILMPLQGQTSPIDQILALPCTIEVGTEHCVIRELLLDVKRAIERILTSTSLADLGRRQQELSDQSIHVPLDLPAPGGLARLPVLKGG